MDIQHHLSPISNKIQHHYSDVLYDFALSGYSLDRNCQFPNICLLFAHSNMTKNQDVLYSFPQTFFAMLYQPLLQNLECSKMFQHHLKSFIKATSLPTTQQLIKVETDENDVVKKLTYLGKYHT